MEDSVNTMIDDLLWPTAEVTRAIAAVAKGDLSQTMRLDVEGRPLEGGFLRSATIVNTMIDQMSVFTSEVTRVAREVGTDGKLGGQAQVKDLSGAWKDLTDNVNSMAGNLTAQVRNISEVTIAIASGDLSRKITVDVRGEILQLKEAINTMVDQLRSFASEVTRVAREVGTEGKLGGQAQVPGVAGTWKDLTDNVNGLASNLTSQVRNIAEVTIASRARRPLAQDHRRRPRRDPAAQGSHQHDGRPAPLVRVGGHARGARGRNRKASSAVRRRCRAWPERGRT
jgi:HAMP domain-containing protein